MCKTTEKIERLLNGVNSTEARAIVLLANLIDDRFSKIEMTSKENHEELMGEIKEYKEIVDKKFENLETVSFFSKNKKVFWFFIILIFFLLGASSESIIFQLIKQIK